MGYVGIVKISHDATSRQRYSFVLFNGLFIDIKIDKDFHSNLSLIGKKIIKNNNIKKEEEIKVNSTSLEERFKIYCLDKEFAIQFLSLEVMEGLIKADNELEGVSYQVMLKDNHIYLNIDCGDIFAPISYQEKESLYRCYQILNIAFDLIKLLINQVEKM